MALGEKLRNARLNAKLTTTQVATATRIKIQIIEDIEREDFRRVAAPIYGKGFIRLFAEKVGLDPVPLVEEYVGRFVNPVQVQLITDKGHVLQGSKKLEPLAPHQLDANILPDLPKEQDLFSATKRTEIVPPSAEQPVKTEKEFPEDHSKTTGSLNKIISKCRERINNLSEQVKSINDPWRRRDFSLPVIRFVESPIKWLSVLLGTIVIVILLLSTISRVFHRNQKENAVPRVEETRAQLRLGAEPPAPYVN
ncbi:MAG: helix-turn-helix transcriptional regulator [Kiritimatiellae bacterium]|nr:helix-turn-helix transcriptional regulator [Kiritimatiellia bacterium]MDD5519277.1 helix-turn-helix transcriptional regulator [Kiritimatiellia bacterium]